MTDSESQLEETILMLLDQRSPGKTICPSEAARFAFPDDWREFMEATREAAIRLVAQGALEICQGGEVVDPSAFSGPIRLRRPI